MKRNLLGRAAINALTAVLSQELVLQIMYVITNSQPFKIAFKFNKIKQNTDHPVGTQRSGELVGLARTGRSCALKQIHKGYLCMTRKFKA